MLQKIGAFFRPFILTLIGIIAVNYINIFNYISFIPQDRVFIICLPLYVGALDFLLREILGFARKKFVSEINVLFSIKDTIASKETTPVIKFNMEDLAEIRVLIQVSGKKAHFIGTKLVIPNIGFATMQLSKKDDIASVDIDGNLIIKLEDVFGSVEERTIASTKFDILFIREPVESERKIDVGAKFIDNCQFYKRRIIYRGNKFRIMGDEK